MTPAIYTIARNEEGNAAAFVAAAEGAPVYVLDTGSTDGTVKLLRKAGAVVRKAKIEPWRFDAARNAALAMVPKKIDLCLSLDLDERIEPGWRKKLAREWRGNIGNYRYVAAWADAGRTVPAVEGPRTRIHAREGFEWHRRVHEVIRPLEGVALDPCDTTIVVRHHQDGRQRSYAPLLSEMIAENPDDADSRLQRAGEWMQLGRWESAIEDYRAWLRITEGDERPEIRWRRASLYIGMAQARWHLDDRAGAARCYMMAAACEPACRDAWVHVAHTMLQIGNAPLAWGAAMTALGIGARPYHATVDAMCWGEAPARIAAEALARLPAGSTRAEARSA